MTKSQLFKHAHNITKLKDTAYYGGYAKTFAMVLKQCYAEQPVYGFNV